MVQLYMIYDCFCSEADPGAGRRGPEPLKYVRLPRVFALQMKQLQPPGRTQLSLG